MKFSPKDVIYIGVLSAICAIATTLLIPLPTGGMVHLGSAALYTISILFGGLYGGLAGAIGSGFFDLVMGQSPYTLFSIVIKGLAGVIVGTMVTGFYPPTLKTPTAGYGKIIFALLVGSIWTAFGYYIAWAVVLNSTAVAFTRLPASFLTSGMGIIVALLVAPKLQKIIRRMR